MRKRTLTTLVAGTMVAAASAWAAHAYVVAELGENGWISGDTRPGGALSFVEGPLVPPYGDGSLRLETNNTAAAKATLELQEDLGALVHFAASYAIYRTAGQPAVMPGLKLGIDTPDPNPTSATAIARGEDRFDKILIYEPYLNPLGRVLSSGVWIEEVVTQTSGRWWIVDLDGSPAPGYGINGPYKTLADWLADPAYGATLSAGSIVSMQLGVGSGNPGFDGNVDYLQYTVASGTHIADFESIGDSDGDGIRDDQDECPDSDLSSILVIGTCDTGVANVLFENGCTLSDLIAGLRASSNNHGQFVSGVASLTNALAAEGVITNLEKAAIQKCAAKSK